MIKNYTSNVPVERTVQRIEAALVGGGANGIVKDYKDGLLIAICFTVTNPSGRHIAVRLPANVQGVYDAMRERIKRPRAGTLKKLYAQAERTAWKLAQDWVEVQMTRIALRQSDFMQAFLSEVWDGKQTFYNYIQAGGYKLLPGAQ